MKTALFIILPYPSHYNASFGLAHEFQDRGFRVVFTGYPHLREHVEKQGYAFCSMEYASEYDVKTVKGFISFFLRSLLDKGEVLKRYRAWYKSITEVREIHKHYQPEHIFLDAHLSHYYLFLIEHRKTITMLSTKLSMKKSSELPPLNSLYVPGNTHLSRLSCEFLWINYLVKAEFRALKNRIAFLNRDELYFQKRLCRKQGIRWDTIFEKQNVSFVGLKNVPTIILGTEKLEFPQRKTFPNERYIYLPIRRNEEKYFTDTYVQIRERIQCLSANYRTIYCAMGTLSGPRATIVLRFMKNVIGAVEMQKNLLLVISTGSLNLSIKVDDDRIFLVEQVPQLDMLRYCDMMITHGGHNSIKECLQAGVPMLVYPLNNKVNQPGNAIRVYTHGYGLFGKLDKDTPEVILSKMNRVLGMRENMKQVCQSDALGQSLAILNSWYGKSYTLEI